MKFLQFAVLVVLTACTQQYEPIGTQGGFNLPLGLQRTTLPYQDLRAFVEVDEQQRQQMTIDITTGKAQLTISDLKSGNHSFTIEFEYAPSGIGSPVPLVRAVIDRELGKGKNITLSVAENDYEYIDSDNDSFNNLIELEAKTDPMDADSKPPPVFSMSGSVVLGGVSALAGVTVSLHGPVGAETVTDTEGRFQFDRLPNGIYDVTPAYSGYTFSPLNRQVLVDNKRVQGRNFTALAVGTTYAISGQIKGPGGNALADATVSLAGNTAGFTATDIAGNYSIVGLPNGTYEIRAAKDGFTFNPGVDTVTINNAGQANRDFTAAQFTPPSRYTMSGTISYNGNETGNIYLRLRSQSGSEVAYGTVIQGPGAFAIRGLEAGTYELTAFMDQRGAGIRHATNPQGVSDTYLVNADESNVDIQILDPPLRTLGVPQGNGALGTDGMALIVWDSVRNSTGDESPDSYNVYWNRNTVVPPTPMVHDGSVSVDSRGDEFYFHDGLINGDTYVYVVTAVFNGVESNTSGLLGPVTIGPYTAGASVSGSVSFAGNYSNGVLRVGLYNDQFTIFAGTSMAAPSSPRSFTLTGVPDGIYFIFAFLDRDNNGVADDGDIFNTENLGFVSVDGGTIENLDLHLPDRRGAVYLSTIHDLGSERYGIGFDVYPGTDFPVAATVVGGPNLSFPIDLIHERGRTQIQFRVDTLGPRPVVASEYVIQLHYRDLTTEAVSVPITGVSDSFAQQVSPVSTTITDLTPTFTWAAPLSPPLDYFYSLTVELSGGIRMWSTRQLYRNLLSVDYNFDNKADQELQPNSDYVWYLTLDDEYRNKSRVTSKFSISQ